MIRIGITGGNGFIGSNLGNYIRLNDKQYELIDFNRCFFEDNKLLDRFISKCDVVIHLAGLNRHSNQELIFETNVRLARILTESIQRTGNLKKLIFSSSIQENSHNIYGESKRVSRGIFEKGLENTKCSFVGLIIPNVFGPFCNPNYNSVIATFCDKICKQENTEIINDKKLELIYVDELIHYILDIINGTKTERTVAIQATATFAVSEILEKLRSFDEEYIQDGIIPNIESRFNLNLFNTFRSYIDISEMFPKKYLTHTDERGSFTELIRTNTKGQFSFSTTKKGITRGNHYHTRKIERFSVIKGKAKVSMRMVNTSNTVDLYLDGDSPSYVDIPIWHTHNITNIGDSELVTCFWINEAYDSTDPDTYFENV